MKELLTLNKYLYKYRGRLLLGSFFITLGNFLSIYMISFIGKAMNIIQDAIEARSKGLPIPEDDKTDIWIYGGIIVGLPIIAGILSFLKRQTMIATSRLIEFDLKNTIFKHYQTLDLGFYKNNRTGDLMNRISEDVGYVRQYLGPGIMYPIDLLTRATILITVMLSYDKVLTLYTLAPLPILSILIYIISKQINKKSQLVQSEQSNLSSYVQDIFSGIRVIKAYNKEESIKSSYAQITGEYKNKAISLANTQAFFVPLMVIVIGISQIFVLYAGGKRYIDGDITEIGVVAQFFLYLNMLIWPFTSLGYISMVVQRAEASMKRINEFLVEKSKLISGDYKPSTIRGNIKFEDVSFVYENTGIQALKSVSFDLKEGETLAIMGKTGSGKSTIVQLVARLYDVTSGRILIDGKPIQSYDIGVLRENIGFVPQEAFLFSNTIKENITFASDSSTVDDAMVYAKKADVHGNIVNFKKGYDTTVGERGITLSGGQKQRVSIARALVNDPNILIFDDSLSAVDTETEERIMDNIQEASKDKTTIIITHSVSSARHADKIILLNDGVITEVGTHDSLLQTKGEYYKLYSEQLMAHKNS